MMLIYILFSGSFCERRKMDTKQTINIIFIQWTFFAKIYILTDFIFELTTNCYIFIFSFISNTNPKQPTTTTNYNLPTTKHILQYYTTK